MTEKLTGLALLRAPFPEHQISKLPKPYRKDSLKGECTVCGGFHGLPAMHLDYVGHAALTDRLLDADPNWQWEPLAFDADGLPLRDDNGGLWIKLTVCNVTRLGYGDADSKTGPSATKELIGDALRNAAMRFGAALDLWHKGDLHGDDSEEEQAAQPQKAQQTRTNPDDSENDAKKQCEQIHRELKDMYSKAVASVAWYIPSETWAGRLVAMRLIAKHCADIFAELGNDRGFELIESQIQPKPEDKEKVAAWALACAQSIAKAAK